MTSIVKKYTITNVINNKFGEVKTIVYDQCEYSDGKVTTTQNTTAVGGITILEVGIDYSDYYLKESYPMGNNILNVFFPKIPVVEEQVADLTDVFDSMSLNPYRNKVVESVPQSSTTVQTKPEPEETSEYEYPLCPICQDDILEVDDEDNFLCSRCGGYFDSDFDEIEIRRIALSKGVKLQPLVPEESEEQEV